MFCQNCGTQISSGAKFCPICGSPVQSVPAESYRQDADSASQGRHGASPSQYPQQGSAPTPPSSYYGQQVGGQPAGQQGYPQQGGTAPYQSQQGYGNHSAYGQQYYGQPQQGQQPWNQGAQGAAAANQVKKGSSRTVVVIVAIAAVVVIALVLMFAFGVFSPKGGGSTAAQPPAQSSAQSASQGGGATGAPASSATPADTPSSNASASEGSAQSGVNTPAPPAVDALQQAKDKAFAEGYQVFEGTVRVLSAEDLASFQGVDPRVAEGVGGTYAVLVFDASIQVSGMGADGSGMRRQGATMLGMASQTSYGSSGDIGMWKAHDGEHLVIAAMAEDIVFPSDVSLPVGEPKTSAAKILG